MKMEPETLGRRLRTLSTNPSFQPMVFTAAVTKGKELIVLKEQREAGTAILAINPISLKNQNNQVR